MLICRARSVSRRHDVARQILYGQERERLAGGGRARRGRGFRVDLRARNSKDRVPAAYIQMATPGIDVHEILGDEVEGLTAGVEAEGQLTPRA